MPPRRGHRAPASCSPRSAGIGSAAQAFWLAGQILREDGDLDGAVLRSSRPTRGLTIARDAANRARAASDLIDVLRATGQHDRADQVIATLTSGS
ncbi:MAG: hypothetical protein IPP00_00010 [Actinomycetales bacterium]|uniref:Uncharacterized protein n=1 Tax=Candidatus Phosphoribacter hodrii TaxID=2953743 RepID=A0A9D7T4C5_9MICO|nr:hypothetical protein [Candidatus Phosphoribacter hodrii]